MVKKIIIISLIFLAVGAAGYSWVTATRTKEQRLKRENRRKLDVSLNKLDKLVTGEIEIDAFARERPFAASFVSKEGHLQQREIIFQPPIPDKVFHHIPAKRIA